MNKLIFHFCDRSFIQQWFYEKNKFYNLFFIFSVILSRCSGGENSIRTKEEPVRYLVSDENKIISDQLKKFKLEEILGFTKSSERVVFYYWYESGRMNNEIYSYGLKIN